MGVHVTLDIHPLVGQLHEYDMIPVAILTTEHFQVSMDTKRRFVSVQPARGVPMGYVEGLNDARTLPADFFSTLLAAILHVQGVLA